MFAVYVNKSHIELGILDIIIQFSRNLITSYRIRRGMHTVQLKWVSTSIGILMGITQCPSYRGSTPSPSITDTHPPCRDATIMIYRIQLWIGILTWAQSQNPRPLISITMVVQTMDPWTSDPFLTMILLTSRSITSLIRRT